jgi:sugar/nucleoside kinase (ribokinase family)
VHAETGERIFAGFEHSRRMPLAVEELDRAYITSAEFLHLDGYHSDAALQAARWMHAAGKRVMLDGSATRGPMRPQMRALVAEADVLICGEGFGPALTEQPFDPTPENLYQIGERILDLGPEVVVQTQGVGGSYTVARAASGAIQFHVPAFEIDVVDTTGAGDVFHGAFLVGLLRGWDLRTVATFSSAVSAIKCTQLSGRRGIPSFEQTIAFLRDRNIDVMRDE